MISSGTKSRQCQVCQTMIDYAELNKVVKVMYLNIENMNICFDKYDDNNKDNDSDHNNDKEATVGASNNEMKEVVGNINTNENTTTSINTSSLLAFPNNNNCRVLSTSPSLTLTLVYHVESPPPAITLVTGLTTT